jgi:hypothetical protein
MNWHVKQHDASFHTSHNSGAMASFTVAIGCGVFEMCLVTSKRNGHDPG